VWTVIPGLGTGVKFRAFSWLFGYAPVRRRGAAAGRPPHPSTYGVHAALTDQLTSWSYDVGLS